MKTEKQAPTTLQIALEKVHKDGFNIYILINKLKKQMSQPKDWQFPDEVLLGVCRTYEQDKTKIEKPWPWFVKVIKIESALWHAQQQINANKKNRSFPQSLRDIMKSVK